VVSVPKEKEKKQWATVKPPHQKKKVENGKKKKKTQKRQIERRNFIPIISKAPGKHTTFSLILKLQVCGRRCAVCKLEDLS